MARRSFRRRKRKVVWLPNTGTPYGAGRFTAGDTWDGIYTGIETTITTNATSEGRTTIEIPLFVDQPPEETFHGSSVAAYQGSGLSQTMELGYLLHRVVGKHFFYYGPQDLNAQNPTPPVQVDVGVIVRRVDAETGGSIQTAAGVDVAGMGNNRDPWLYRRTFIFQGVGSSLTLHPLANFLNNNPSIARGTFECGSKLDGPFFDIKSKRRVGPEERLFWDITMTVLPFPASGDQLNLNIDQGLLYININYRGLASIMTNIGNRRNASR